MKVFAAGISTETNTFRTVPTELADFCIQVDDSGGAGVAASGACDLDLTSVWNQRCRALGHDYIFGFMAWAPPGGVTRREAYECLRNRLLETLLAASPVDVVMLMLHGAMVAEGYDDCEEDLIRSVRTLVGPGVVIGVELDLHCHLSAAKIEPADIVITFKEYPHVDSNARAVELLDLAIAAKSGRIRPAMALFDCRMLGLYPTSREPLRGFVDAMIQAECREGVLSISMGHGFPFSDIPHGGAKLLVVSDNDPSLALRLADELGHAVYDLRHQIGFESLSLPLDQALSKALAADAAPVVVADQSDNPGGGAAGDATFALHWLLDHDAQDVGMAIFCDPEVVALALAAGEGAALPVRLGGKRSAFSGDPIDLNVLVTQVRTGYIHEFPQASGAAMRFPLGDVVALRSGTIDLVVSSEPCQCYTPSVFIDLGIDPSSKRILVPKSAQHFYQAFAPIAAEVIYMAGPGAVAPDPRRLPYRRLNTANLYPWTDDPLGTA